MMCSCDEEFGQRFFPHQLSHGTDLVTKQEQPVTVGFQKGICNTCRGMPEEPYPRSEIYGCSTKIRRYYWREIECETVKRFGEWAEKQGYTDWLRARFKEEKTYESIERKVIEEIKDLHQRSPKYKYIEESQNDVVVKYGVKIINLSGVYVKGEGRGVKILYETEKCSPEEFAARYFENLGFNAIYLESSPFHALFGVLMFSIVQDPIDPRVRIIGFGNREAFDLGIGEKGIWTTLPEDFGASGYALRREREINEYLDALPQYKEDLLWLFDLWVEYSADLRQYLWAHRMAHVSKARMIINILPTDAIIRILGHLVKDYWGNYLGWPDLLIYKEDEFFLVEVKSSSDKLSEDQKNWIKGNANELKLPFCLVKIHKSK